MVQYKGNWDKELKFNNCSESVRHVHYRTLVEHVSIICYNPENVLEIAQNILQQFKNQYVLQIFESTQ